METLPDTLRVNNSKASPNVFDQDEESSIQTSPSYKDVVENAPISHETKSHDSSIQPTEKLSTEATEPRFLSHLQSLLADGIIETERRKLMEPLRRESLDSGTSEPWDEHINPLFNDVSFKSERVTTLSNGVTPSDI